MKMDKRKRRSVVGRREDELLAGTIVAVPLPGPVAVGVDELVPSPPNKEVGTGVGLCIDGVWLSLVSIGLGAVFVFGGTWV
jgi:hypothetical protein